MRQVAVIGGGAWGTALACAAVRAGRAVKLWAYEAETVAAINQRHENPTFLPGIALDPGIEASSDLEAVLAAADLVLAVTPAQHLRRVLSAAEPALAKDTPVLLCAKGIEQLSGALMNEVAAEVLPGRPLGVLSGPTFAAEVARGLPTAVTLAAADIALADRIAAALASASFRPYASDDVVGAEIGGAVKNVLAIACGIVVGRELGENARAALITRGMAEILRFGEAKGARAETLMGLAGMGDLILTCSSQASRNMSLGVALAQGQDAGEVLNGRASVAEGAHTAPILASLAAQLALAMPIVCAVNEVLYHGLAVDSAIERLLNRPLKREIG
ncbi:MAG: NAD(P)H-dependent glycerol-3-phosphate dehydrogenase [Sphingomonadales bacterium]